VSRSRRQGGDRAADSDPAALQARAIEAVPGWTAHPGPLVLDERSGSSLWRRG
jgi:hypothetical protein